MNNCCPRHGQGRAPPLKERQPRDNPPSMIGHQPCRVRVRVRLCGVRIKQKDHMSHLILMLVKTKCFLL